MLDLPSTAIGQRSWLHEQMPDRDRPHVPLPVARRRDERIPP